MTLECTKADGSWNDYGSAGYGWHCLFELGRAISAHAGWNIIDSYAATASPARVNGDPFSGGTWGGLTKASNPNNSWLIFEQANPTGGRPAMQIKYQNANASNFADPSGDNHGMSADNRLLAVRFAPFGGWDLDPSTPDFANASTKGTDNLYTCIANADWYYHIDDDHVMILQYGAGASDWYSISHYIGEYTPMFAAQDTVDHPAYMFYGGQEYTNQPSSPIFQGITSSANQIIAEDPPTSDNTPHVWCPDENGLMQFWKAYCPPMSNGFIEGVMTPNEFDSSAGIDLLEVLFAGLATTGSPDTRMIGSLKHIWRGWGIGAGGFLGSKEYLTLGSNVSCAIVDWDGATSL